MKVERVFKTVPSDDLILRFLQILGIVSFQDTHWWPYSLFSTPSICQSLEVLLPELEPFYMNHKKEIIQREMTPRRYLTILRHLLRARGLDIEGHEVHSSKMSYMNRMNYRLINPNPVVVENDAIFTVTFQ
jgi:hypothetical protein